MLTTITLQFDKRRHIHSGTCRKNFLTHTFILIDANFASILCFFSCSSLRLSNSYWDRVTPPTT